MIMIKAFAAQDTEHIPAASETPQEHRWEVTSHLHCSNAQVACMPFRRAVYCGFIGLFWFFLGVDKVCVDWTVMEVDTASGNRKNSPLRVETHSPTGLRATLRIPPVFVSDSFSHYGVVKPVQPRPQTGLAMSCLKHTKKIWRCQGNGLGSIPAWF